MTVPMDVEKEKVIEEMALGMMRCVFSAPDMLLQNSAHFPEFIKQVEKAYAIAQAHFQPVVDEDEVEWLAKCLAASDYRSGGVETLYSGDEIAFAHDQWPTYKDYAKSAISALRIPATPDYKALYEQEKAWRSSDNASLTKEIADLQEQLNIPATPDKKPAVTVEETRVLWETISFYRSVIQSGESWTKTCDDQHMKVCGVLTALETRLAQGGV